MTQKKEKVLPVEAGPYCSFKKIDGYHPFKEKVPGAYVDYFVRRRKSGKVLYFNFDLAKEMGLIEEDHPHKLNKNLTEAILDTFSLMIINEYDLIHHPEKLNQIHKQNLYMSTRYLQLQHANKKGKFSGDGRSIWNGVFSDHGQTWDVTSCGTGATCLSPATSKYGRFFQTGDPSISYGCGYSEILDGLSAAMMSEIFHKNNIATERTLVLIEYPGNFSINVRVGKNLLRPSHFFIHLKQNQYKDLKSVTDYYIGRQIENGVYPKGLENDRSRYAYFLEHMCDTFARMAAKFEREYIFCWLDWDGDNILCDGGIIDYGSIRQFGLFHSEYRYDDTDRFSTTLTQQKAKAKYIVQTFAQIVDFLQHQKKKNLKEFSKHPILQRFDEVFQRTKDELLLEKMGFNRKFSQYILSGQKTAFKNFENVYSYFETAKSKEGPIEVPDGITVNAVYCMRDILRELPSCYLKSFQPISPEGFIEIIKSIYAAEDALTLTPGRIRKIMEFQEYYKDLVVQVARGFNLPIKRVLLEMNMRSSVINRYERVTGDAVIHLASKMYNNRKKISSTEFHKVYDEFVSKQVLVPGKRKRPEHHSKLKGLGKGIVRSMLQIVKNLREGI